MVDARLADGSRVNIVLPPLVLNGGSISIRKFPKQSPDARYDGAAAELVARTRAAPGDRRALRGSTC